MHQYMSDCENKICYFCPQHDEMLPVASEASCPLGKRHRGGTNGDCPTISQVKSAIWPTSWLSLLDTILMLMLWYSVGWKLQD